MRNKLKTQIIQVIGVLLSAIACAAILAAFMIYHYGPSGHYLAGNAILSPDTLKKMSYKDLNPQTGQSSRFVFNSIEFSYFDKVDGQLYQFSLDPAIYGKLYLLLASTKSLDQASAEVINNFNNQIPATLSLTVRADNGTVSHQVVKVFQVIQFTENDYFRVQLQGGNSAGDWIYFYQPHIYQDMIHLFKKT